MGTAASTTAARRQWQAVDEAKSSRNAEREQENGNNIGGVAKLMEAKSRFLKTRQGREGNTASTQKQVVYIVHKCFFFMFTCNIYQIRTYNTIYMVTYVVSYAT